MKEEEYKGCQNCIYQIEPLRSCEWLEHGGDGRVHLICPRWKIRAERKTKAEYIVEKRQTSGGWTWAEPKEEVIRCEDCIYADFNNLTTLDVGRCTQFGTGKPIFPDDFCSDGRKCFHE